MKRTTALRQLQVSATGAGLVSRGGLALLAETSRVSGVERELRRRLGPWARRRAVHGPARVVLQLAISLAAGGDCLADIGMLRDHDRRSGAERSDGVAGDRRSGRCRVGRARCDRRRARRGSRPGARRRRGPARSRAGAAGC